MEKINDITEKFYDASEKLGVEIIRFDEVIVESVPDEIYEDLLTMKKMFKKLSKMLKKQLK